MKKFLIICLSIVMILSTLLFCGFASPKSVSAAQEEQWEIVEVDGVEYYKKPLPEQGYLKELYFDLTQSENFIDYVHSVVVSGSPLNLFTYEIAGLQRTFSIIYSTSTTTEADYRLSSPLNRDGTIYDNYALLYWFLNEENIFYFTNGFSSPVLYDVEITFLTNQYLNYLDNLSSFMYTLEEVPPPPPSFVGSLIDGMGQVFTEYVPLLATGILSMFSGLFWQDGAFTILGYAFVVFAGIALVGSIFYIVYRIFKGKMRKRL